MTENYVNYTVNMSPDEAIFFRILERHFINTFIFLKLKMGLWRKVRGKN